MDGEPMGTSEQSDSGGRNGSREDDINTLFSELLVL